MTSGDGEEDSLLGELSEWLHAASVDDARALRVGFRAALLVVLCVFAWFGAAEARQVWWRCVRDVRAGEVRAYLVQKPAPVFENEFDGTLQAALRNELEVARAWDVPRVAGPRRDGVPEH